MPEELPSKNALAIIGDEDAVLGFKAFGFQVYAVKTEDEFKAVLEEVVRKNSAVCLVQDNIYRLAKEEINNYLTQAFPIFIPFAKDGDMALLDNITRDIRLRATGTF